MKPGDHPEFFRLPPPPGTSRESTIVLTADGRFFHEGNLVEKQSLAEAMFRWVARHPDDGRWILTNGYDWCYLTVEGTAAFVSGLRGAPPSAPIAILAGGGEQPLDASTLRQDEEGMCFATVKLATGGEAEAKLMRHAQTDLAPWLVDDATVEVDGVRHSITPRR